MKNLPAVILLTFCSVTARHRIIFPQCEDQDPMDFFRNLDCSAGTPCTDQCYGSLCGFYTNNSYPDFCNGFFVDICQERNETTPAACGTPPLRHCHDEAALDATSNLPASCSNETELQCTDECTGALCSHFKSTPGYSDVCRALVVLQYCSSENKSIPTSCEPSPVVTASISTPTAIVPGPTPATSTATPENIHTSNRAFSVVRVKVVLTIAPLLVTLGLSAA